MGVEQKRPMSTPGVANLASVEAMARSQLATSWQPAARREALHGGNHGLRQVDDLLHHRAAHCHDVAEIVSAAIGIAAPAGEFLQVVTRTKGRAIRSKQHARG